MSFSAIFACLRALALSALLLPGVPAVAAERVASTPEQQVFQASRPPASPTDHRCSVDARGAVRCAGANSEGQLGDGTLTDRIRPVVVSHLPKVTAVGVGSGFSCALTQTGAVFCWGSNSVGSLGTGVPGDSRVPVPVRGLAAGARDLTVGGSHACAVTARGAAVCWGANERGQLGSGDFVSSFVPVAARGLSSVLTVRAGADHTCAITRQRQLTCWGSNASGQVGTGVGPDVARPTFVARAGVTFEVAVGAWHTCARRSDAETVCWGANTWGQTSPDGGGQPLAVPRVVAGMRGARAIHAGWTTSCADLGPGGLRCWGTVSPAV